ncbi:MAG: DUF6531 domain-containing protein, partial [Ramlibacter sp.]
MGQTGVCSRAGTVISVFNVSAGGTPYASYWIRVYYGTFYGEESCGAFALAVRSAPPYPPIYSCPADSSLFGSQCTCSAGFDEQGGQCVAGTPFPPEGCASGAGGFFQCLNPTPFTPPIGGPNGPWQNDGPPATPGPDLPPPKPNEGGGALPGGGKTMCKAGDPPPPPPNSAGNPISAATGNKYQREVDYAGPGLLQLVRHYNSNGKGWVHNHLLRIRSDASTAVAIRPTGQMLVFTGSGAGPWSSNATVVERLTKLSPVSPSDPAWKLVTADDTVELYDANGLPISVTARGGLGVTMQHAGGLLQSVSDGFGRSLQFQYDAQARLVRVNAPAGESATYAYGANGHLASVTFADGKSRQYLYENTAY